MPRTVIVGDVHGCTGELEDLLEKVRFAEGRDRLVLVGDLLVRGPDVHGVLALAVRLRARAVRGNHEEKLLAWRERGKSLGPDHQRVAQALSEDEWRLLEGLPVWLDLPEHDARVVHAGVVPG
ncbi:MAG TPA: metallophosphoesterase, partial [Polyangiaceae bacterium]|nr:metallophosphoesterase [Polyangiaceae bacterium]